MLGQSSELASERGFDEYRAYDGRSPRIVRLRTQGMKVDQICSSPDKSVLSKDARFPLRFPPSSLDEVGYQGHC